MSHKSFKKKFKKKKPGYGLSGNPNPKWRNAPLIDASWRAAHPQPSIPQIPSKTIYRDVLVKNQYWQASCRWRRLNNVWACIQADPTIRWMIGSCPDKVKLELLRLGCSWNFDTNNNNNTAQKSAQKSGYSNPIPAAGSDGIRPTVKQPNHHFDAPLGEKLPRQLHGDRSPHFKGEQDHARVTKTPTVSIAGECSAA